MALQHKHATSILFITGRINILAQNIETNRSEKSFDKKNYQYLLLFRHGNFLFLF